MFSTQIPNSLILGTIIAVFFMVVLAIILIKTKEDKR